MSFRVHVPQVCCHAPVKRLAPLLLSPERFPNQNHRVSCDECERDEKVFDRVAIHEGHDLIIEVGALGACGALGALGARSA